MRPFLRPLVQTARTVSALSNIACAPTISRALQPQHSLGSTTKCSAECSWNPTIPVFQDIPTSDPLETQAIMVGRCLGRDDRRSTLPVRHQAVIENTTAVRFVGVESPRG